MKGDTARTDLVVRAMTIIDGKALSEKVLKEIEKEHSELEKKVGRKAGLAVIIVGENPASQIYVRNKIRACEKVGFHSETIRLDENITEENLLLEIEKLNNNSNIDGILVQLPIPKHIDGLKIINAISAEKDVDGFHTTNIGKMMIGDETGFLPCTPAGVVHMFEEYNINLEGKDVLVIGQSNIVGKPMTLLLIKKRATVQVCNSKTKNLSEKLQKADVVVAAAGSPKLVKASDVKEDVVVIDVGINRVDGKLCGDVDFEEVSKKASFITPVPGGVGPMTIAMLIKNTFKSYKQKIINILAKVGGLDIAGMAGTFLGCAENRIPIVIDGFISAIAALVAYKICPNCRDFMIASHLSEEPGMKYIMKELDLEPMLFMNMKLGEGTGAVMMFPVIEGACNITEVVRKYPDI